MQLRFTKMNGAGNDFVVVDNREKSLALDRHTIARLCDRHRGVGADGLLAVEPAEKGSDFRMRYYNADGGEAEMCGNGARCFARFASRFATRPDVVKFETEAGEITAKIIGEKVELRMSQPKDLVVGEKLHVEGTLYLVHSINTGVPHAVVPVDDVQTVPVQAHGSALRWDPHFAPKGTNVNFVQLMDDRSLSIRTYERGVEAETLACGTGVVASALVHHQLTGLPSPIRVRVAGGDVLEVAFEARQGEFFDVTLKGPADFVFDGELEL